MINNLNLLRNIGCFDSVTNAAILPLAKLTLLYAENGRGKTTLAAILRSLATGDPIPIIERRRLAAEHPPHAILSCTGGPPDAMFQDGAWNRTLSEMMIFDDVFIDQNVYSGLVVGSGHRQNLHELILGAQGVALNQQLQALIARIEQHNSDLRRLGGAITAAERGTLGIDDFCALPEIENVDQGIEAAEQNLAASRQQDPIRNTAGFQQLNLPEFKLDALDGLLAASVSNLDAAAATRVQEHLESLGGESEPWIAEGMTRQDILQGDGVHHCVFCAQDLSGSPVITHYRAFFGEEYRDLQRSIRDATTALARTHSEGAAVSFERSVGVNVERRQFWAQFGEMPDIEIDTAAINTDWNTARNHVQELIAQKQRAPLDAMEIPENVRAAVESYEAHRRNIDTLNEELAVANDTVKTVKERAATANPVELRSALNLLTATKARHSPVTTALCNEYLQEKNAKVATQQQQVQAREALEQYRTNVFPTYQNAINRYLQRFNAGYHLDSVAAVNTRGGPTCNYNVVVNNTAVAVGGGNTQPGDHTFRNVLSAGDRNTLAVAFFLASLELDPNRGNKVVVIDDPVSSLDEHRSLTTVQEVRRLINQVSQVVILSHNKPFLCRVWENADPALRAALQVVRQGAGSTIESWDVNSDSITENDRRHEAMREYLAIGGQNEREIARCIRPSLEAFFRVAYPEYFPPGTLLGPFRGICNQRVGTPQEILSQGDIDELQDIVDYANLFHHDTNPSWETEIINSTQLEGFVARALAFAKRP